MRATTTSGRTAPSGDARHRRPSRPASRLDPSSPESSSRATGSATYKVDATGKVTLRYRGLLFHLGIGRAYRGRRVVMMLAGPQVRILNEEYQLIRELTIDPTKKYQDQA